MKIESHNHTSDFGDDKLEFRGIMPPIKYDTLVKLFGLPIDGDLYRSDIKWKLRIVLNDDDVIIAELRNFKTGESFLGDEAFKYDKENPYWHISTNKTHEGINIITLIENYVKENK